MSRSVRDPDYRQDRDPYEDEEGRALVQAIHDRKNRLMNMMIAPVDTPLESADKFRKIGEAILPIAPLLTEAFNELGKSAVRTARAFQANYTVALSKRVRRRMQTYIARLDRRPALIHKGGRPR